MKINTLLYKAKLYLAAGLSFLALEQAIAGNVTGTVKSIPQNVPVFSDVRAINKNTNDTTIVNPNSSGAFSINLDPGEYNLEAGARHHYIWRDTSFVVDGDTSLDLRLIRGEYDNGDTILLSTHPYYEGSVLKFAKRQYERLDDDIRKDAMNWASPRRRLYVTGFSDSTTLKNLDTVKSVNESGSLAGIYYDEQLTDSAGGIRIYGVPAGDPNLLGNTAYTYSIKY